MMWLCRPGDKAQYYEKFIQEKRIYLAWEGYNVDLRKLEDKEHYRKLVSEEKDVDNRTTISNWSGQLINFSTDMKVGDYVVIPNNRERIYTLAKISGAYEFVENSMLHHCRRIEIVKTNISRDIFSQQVLYCLGAYRTVFKIKLEKEFLQELGEG